MTELEQYIQSYFGVEKKDIEKINTLFKPAHLKKGEFFLKAGKPVDKLSFIQNGLLRIYANKNEKEITQWISSKGYFVTDLSGLTSGTASRWTIQAITDVDLYTIDKKDYIHLGEIIPQWHHLEKLFIAKCFTILEDRIFSHLSMTAEERYHQLFETNRELLNQVPLNYLASMLGMTPETFSRIRAKKIS
ncbi:MAG: Crp/Fnr family transcriptional regulator [Bacteroidetes bacterium]|nr:Crp/Fnr family transcriptional regulator [Bacteroidota bacterium]